MGYSFLLAARVLLYASSHRQDNTYHTALVTQVMEHWREQEKLNVSSMKDRSDDPLQHEHMFLPQS